MTKGSSTVLLMADCKKEGVLCLQRAKGKNCSLQWVITPEVVK